MTLNADIHDFVYQKSRTEIELSKLALIALQDDDTIRNLLEISFRLPENDANWRAAWLITHIADLNSSALSRHQKEIVNFLNDNLRELSQALLRSHLRTLTLFTFTEDEEGIVLHLCSAIYRSQKYAKAVRVYAIYTLTNILIKYPELAREYLLDFKLIELQEEKALAAACKKAIKRLEKHLSKL